MFELAGTSTKRGVFELKLEKKAPALIRPIVKLGPFKGRALGLIGLALALLFSLSKSPSLFILEQGWAPSLEAAHQLKLNIANAILVVAGIFYFVVFIFRRESLELIFDRPREEFSFFHIPGFKFSQAKQGLAGFQHIEKIEVFSKKRSPQTPHGYLEISCSKFPKDYRNIAFKLLSDEQFEIYPRNIEQITGKESSGDLKSE